MRTIHSKRPFKKEIDAPWVLEVISEKFDSAIELMSDNCVIYGGAIRDALAGLPLLGDLDMAVDQKTDMIIRPRFSDSIKWRPITQEFIPKLKDKKQISLTSMQKIVLQNYRKVGEQPKECIERLITNLNNNSVVHFSMAGGISELYNRHKTTTISNKPSYRPKPHTSYGENISPNIPISNIYSYKDMDGAIVQIMKVKKSETNSGILVNAFDNITHLARMVDIMCCGVVMDKNGKVFEVVEGAYEDCKKRILNINPIIVDESLDIINLETRVLRLIERGWNSNIILDELKTEVIELKVASKKKAKVKFERTQKYKMKTNKNKNIVFDKLVADTYMKSKFGDAADGGSPYQTFMKIFSFADMNKYYGGVTKCLATINQRAAALNIKVLTNFRDNSMRIIISDKDNEHDAEPKRLTPRKNIRALFYPTQTGEEKEKFIQDISNIDEAGTFKNYRSIFDKNQLRHIFGTINTKKISEMLQNRCGKYEVYTKVSRKTNENITTIDLKIMNRKPMTLDEITSYFVCAPKPYNNNSDVLATKTRNGSIKNTFDSYIFSGPIIKRLGGLTATIKKIELLFHGLALKPKFHPLSGGAIKVDYNTLDNEEVHNAINTFVKTANYVPNLKKKMKKIKQKTVLKSNYNLVI